MISKKTKAANLENKRTLFFEIGITITLAAMLAAFQWSTQETHEVILATPIDQFAMQVEVLRNTYQPKTQPPRKIFTPIFKVIVDNPNIPDVDIELFGPDDYINLPIMGYPDELPIDDSIFVVVEDPPEFEGGELNSFRYYVQNMVNYPQMAIDMKLQGRVYTKFIVDKTGKVTGIEIQRGVDPLLDNAVIEALSKSPQWKPGKQNGRPVKVAMAMPIIFKLQ